MAPLGGAMWGRWGRRWGHPSYRLSATMTPGKIQDVTTLHSPSNGMKYTIPTLPYNIAIPNGGGTTQPVQAPNTRLPQHLRSAVADGLCRVQPVDPPTASPGPWSDPDPLAAREEQVIDQLVAQLESRAPGRHTPRQLIIQALQCYLNNGVTDTSNQPAIRTPDRGQHPVGDTISTVSAGRTMCAGNPVQQPLTPAAVVVETDDAAT